MRWDELTDRVSFAKLLLQFAISYLAIEGNCMGPPSRLDSTISALFYKYNIHVCIYFVCP